ncbi:ribokinase [Microvirgula aerodenitrificans]|uniref:ribokinase n=1 Tax=Microvirgula aerodenitrificans TaxID=57480 RepID=UPI00248E72B4|nr:ribokinase [Microvirgula aerodenitrificans]
MPKIVVVGSINMDLVVLTPRYPGLGETLTGERFANFAGGKGANQAVAAARLGADVTLIGCVGNDAFGRELSARLLAEKVDTTWIDIADDVATGVAVITVAGHDNAIVVVPGANHRLRPEHVAAAERVIRDADVVLSQLEVPMDTVLAAARMARKYDKPFILNPAPAQPLDAELLDCLTLITPNEFELARSLGREQADLAELLTRLPGRVIMTRGVDGASYCDADGQLRHQPSFKVDAVDSTGAGDTFNAALATFWHLGIAEAARRACAASALSVTRLGAQGGMPTLAELDQFLASRS